jgi:hypothetical protein
MQVDATAHFEREQEQQNRNICTVEPQFNAESNCRQLARKAEGQGALTAI